MTTETAMEPTSNTTEGQASSVPGQGTEATATATEAQQSSAQAQGTQDSSTPTGEAPATTQETAPVVPEKYEFTMPEGVTLDPGVESAFSEVAKELSLSQESAQKVMGTMAPVIAKIQQEQHVALVESWKQELKGDKEIGGDKLSENLGIANKAYTRFGSPKLVALLQESGLSEHPEVVRAFFKIGKSISEDTFVAGSVGSTPSSDLASRLYTRS